MNKILKRVQNDLKKIDKRGWLLILVGTVTWSLTMIKSGLVYDYGMGFWGPNGHDGVWHISVAQSLANGSWRMPIFAGETIKNYHVGFDLLLAVLHKLTFIPIHTLYFQILPPIFALGIGLSVYLFVLTWKKSKLAAYWSTFFIYFGGSFGWIITLFREGKIGGESMFWVQQSVSTLINPPFALSLLLIFAGLCSLIKAFKTHATYYFLLTTFIFGILVQVKVYAGLLCLGGLLVSGLWQMIRKRDLKIFKVFVGSLIISVLIFAPLSKDIGSALVYKPFWFLETMMANTDRLYWPKFAEAMINYKLGGAWLKLFFAYAITFFIFWYGNVGIRLIKEVYLANLIIRKKKADWVDIFLFSIIFAGILVPTFFIQSGNSWNSIQFIYYSLMFSGIFAGIVMEDFLKGLSIKRVEYPRVSIENHPRGGIGRHPWVKLRKLCSRSLSKLLVVLLTIPTTIGTLWYHYLPSRPPAKISKEELEALEFLKKQPDGVVLTIPFDKKKAEAAINSPPRPLYLYESTAYVSAFSGKQVFMEDEVNLEITSYNWQERLKEIETFFGASSVEQVQQFLEESNIDYVYWTKGISSSVFEKRILINKIYGSDEIEIFKVNNSELGDI